MRLRVEREGIEVWQPEFEDLAALPEQVAHPSTLFRGLTVGAIRLRSLLAVLPAADHVTFRSTDGSATTFRAGMFSNSLSS